MGSKYIKDKGASSNSKYIRNKDDSSRSGRSGDSSEGLSGRARYLEMLEREQEMKDTLEFLESDTTAAERMAIREEKKKEAEKKEAEKRATERKSTPGKAASILKIDKSGEGSVVAFSTPSEIEAKPLANEDEDEKIYRKVIIRNIITCSILCVIALILQIANFRLPLMPEMMKLDLSAIPELLAAISFGPIAGAAIVLIKNLFYVLIYGSAVNGTALSNVILDTVFVTITSLIFVRGMFSPMAVERRMMEDPDGLRDSRGPMIIKSGLVGAVVTTALSYFTNTKLLYPLIFRQFAQYGYTEERYVAIYNDALRALNSHLPGPLSGIVTEITTLKQGVLFYNLPITFAKLIFVTIFVALAFKGLCKILFYRPNIDPEDADSAKKRSSKEKHNEV